MTRAWHLWPVYVLRWYAVQAWRDLPGPWFVKVLLIAVCLAIPGGFDEIALIALARYFRARKARQARQGR